MTAFRVWRIRLGLSQREVAEILGYGKRRIEAYDRGEEDPPIIVRLGMTAVEANMQPYPKEIAA